MKKWAVGIASTVILVPALVLVWNHLGKVWGAPKKLETVEQAVIQQAETQETLKDVYLQQDKKLELLESEQRHQRELTTVQVEALKELLRK